MKDDLIVLTWAGIGDVMVCTPTFRAIKESYPHRRLIVYCTFAGHYDLLRCNQHIDSLRRLKALAMWRYPRHLCAYLSKGKTTLKYYHLRFQHVAPPWLYNKHITEIIPEVFDFPIRLRDTTIQIFLSTAEDQWAKRKLAPLRNPIIIHAHSRSSLNHHWDLDRWSQLVRELPQYTFIQLGHQDEKPIHGTLDWRGKTTLRQALSLLKHSSSFVGIDSSFAHATNAFGLPGVVLFGDSSPLFWGQPNNINIYKPTPCSPCYYYLGGGPCPYGHECMKSISVAEVKEALQRQMNMSSRCS